MKKKTKNFNSAVTGSQVPAEKGGGEFLEKNTRKREYEWEVKEGGSSRLQSSGDGFSNL